MKITDFKIMLLDDWNLYKSTPDEYQHPSELDFSLLQATRTSVPSTVASSLKLPEPECWTPPLDYDDFDWWYQRDFEISDINQSIVFEGLATLANVWINDELILTSENMFITHTIELDKTSASLKNINTLTICFRALNQELKNKRPRPKWKTKLVQNQSLRWFRTTLLGRIPGWSPPVSPVGPWRPIYIQDNFRPYNIILTTEVVKGSGIVYFSCEIDHSLSVVESYIQIGAQKFQVELGNNNENKNADTCKLETQFILKDLELWWPHTHGEPKLYQPTLIIKSSDKETEYELSKIGFRTVELERTNEEFKININNQLIFCRGACWTTNDIISLNSDKNGLREVLTLMRDAGTNMIRIGGTMIYETDDFYQLCNEFGIMIWQDFMFANMDYPFEDESFLSNALLEVKQQVERLKQQPSVILFCGNSEIQQQVSMLGFDKSMWEITFFEKTLAKLCFGLAPNHPYVSSSPSGGDLPFRSNQGLSHYYGVGAYLCPISELRNHNVKFTSECLGFSNIPELNTRNKVLNGQTPVTHNPIWKQRTPRDSGTGWDFEDIRDHYLKELFAVDPIKLRSFDPEKYMQLSEIVTGEIMSQSFSEWRSKNSNCNGGLVWFLKDLWPGAGWGLIDSNNNPKACFYYLKRTWQPISLHYTNESINGVDLHLINESDRAIDFQLDIMLLDKNNHQLGSSTIHSSIGSRDKKKWGVEDLVGHFCDPSYSYHFGPLHCQVIIASLKTLPKAESRSSISFQCNAFFFPGSHTSPEIEASIDISLIETNKDNDSNLVIELQSDKFLYALKLEVKGYQMVDNFFHVPPNIPMQMELIPNGKANGKLKGFISAINLSNIQKFKL